MKQDLLTQLANNKVNTTSVAFMKHEEAAVARARAAAVKARQAGKQPHPAIGFVKNLIALVQAAVTFLVILVVQGVGLLIALFAGIWLEIQATTKGFAILDPQNATGYASVSVLLFVLLLFVQAYTTTGRRRATRFSFRNLVDDVKYLLGMGDDWKRQQFVPRTDIRWVIRLFIVSIVLFGFLGRLNEVALQAGEGAWYTTIEYLLTQASFNDFVATWGNVVYTFALSFGLHFVIEHIYDIYETLAGGVSSSDFFYVLPDVNEKALIEAELTALYQRLLDRKLSQNDLTE